MFAFRSSQISSLTILFLYDAKCFESINLTNIKE